jgi:glucose-6-phosphate isomerase
MIAPDVEFGVREEDVQGARDDFAGAMAVFQKRRAVSELGFLALPTDETMLRSCVEMAARFEGSIDDVVVLAIGGSALGTIAVRNALRPYDSGKPRLRVIDNVDPGTMLAMFNDVSLDRALFLVVSKSGTTVETMAQYAIVRAVLTQRFGESARKRMVFVTDPERGALREIARRDGIAAVDVPPNVGGRFSVLSPVGILPALLAGIDARAMLAGAADMRSRCEPVDAARNPAGMFALLQWLAHERLGAGIHVLMPYSDRLREFADWFVQLWAESLGKWSSDGSPTGPTPIASLGATDQHSQLQLFAEGPLDKTVTFVSVKSHHGTLPIPASGFPDNLQYLAGRDLAELLEAERMATAGALALSGRPNMTIEMPAVDAYHVGALIMMLEVATVIAGGLYKVNPLDQPGVELGKQLTRVLLSRGDSDGNSNVALAWRAVPPSRGDRRI